MFLVRSIPASQEGVCFPHCRLYLFLRVEVGQRCGAGLLSCRQSTEFDPADAIPKRLPNLRSFEIREVSLHDRFQARMKLHRQRPTERLRVGRLTPGGEDRAMFAQQEDIRRERCALMPDI